MMLSRKALLILLVIKISGSYSQFLNCNWVNSLNCKTYTPGEICGTNGITYANRCYLAKAECADKTLRQMNDGPCVVTTTSSTTRQAPTTTSTTTTSSTPSTTALPAVIKPTSDPLNVICNSMSTVHCANDIEPICGSNGRTYINACEFHVEVCKQHDLTIKHIGFC